VQNPWRSAEAVAARTGVHTAMAAARASGRFSAAAPYPICAYRDATAGRRWAMPPLRNPALADRPRRAVSRTVANVTVHGCPAVRGSGYRRPKRQKFLRPR
jgi:hypothetical protein